MARQLENQFFAFDTRSDIRYIMEDIEVYKSNRRRKYNGNCSFEEQRNKVGIRVIVYEKQKEKDGEER